VLISMLFVAYQTTEKKKLKVSRTAEYLRAGRILRRAYIFCAEAHVPKKACCRSVVRSFLSRWLPGLEAACRALDPLDSLGHRLGQLGGALSLSESLFEGLRCRRSAFLGLLLSEDEYFFFCKAPKIAGFHPVQARHLETRVTMLDAWRLPPLQTSWAKAGAETTIRVGSGAENTFAVTNMRPSNRAKRVVGLPGVLLVQERRRQLNHYPGRRGTSTRSST